MDIAINTRTPRLFLQAMKEEDAKDVLEILCDKETAEQRMSSSILWIIRIN